MNMGADERRRKLRIAGLSIDTDDDMLDSYFSKFGELANAFVQKSDFSGRSRGFGFVTFVRYESVVAVLTTGPHLLDGRTIDPQIDNPGVKRESRYWTNRLFLGGLPRGVTEVYIRSVFKPYGDILSLHIVYDEYLRNRGFGFVSFYSAEPVERLLAERAINVNGKRVHIRRYVEMPRTFYRDRSNRESDSVMPHDIKEQRIDNIQDKYWGLLPTPQPQWGRFGYAPVFGPQWGAFGYAPVFGPPWGEFGYASAFRQSHMICPFGPTSANFNHPQQSFGYEFPRMGRISSFEEENLNTTLSRILKSYEGPSNLEAVSLDMGGDEWVGIDLTHQPPNGQPGNIYGRLINPLKAKSNFGFGLHIVYLFIIIGLISSYFFNLEDPFFYSKNIRPQNFTAFETVKSYLNMTLLQ